MFVITKKLEIMEFTKGDKVRITTKTGDIDTYNVRSISKETIYYRDDHTKVQILPTSCENYDHNKVRSFYIETLNRSTWIDKIEILTP